MATSRITRFVVGLWLTLLVVACTPFDDEEPAPFAVSVTPTEIVDVAPGQRALLLLTIEDEGEGTGEGDAVEITASAPDSEVIIEPSSNITPGQVGEISVIVSETVGNDAGAILIAAQPEPEFTIDVSITAEREGLTETVTVPLGIVPNGDFPLEEAIAVRDVFVPWLAEEHPELGITPETEWIATPTKPHWLVVSHYLFISDQWEMGVRWHIMIPPDDWGEIYLRERFVEVQPSLGFKVDSRSELTEPYEVEVVEPVWR